MNKLYTMNNEVRNSFCRMLKSVAENSDLSWTENTEKNTVSFNVSGCESAITLVDKFNTKMNTVRLVIRAKSKFKKPIEKIVSDLNGTFMNGTKKDYFIVILDRSSQAKLHKKIAEKDIKSSISCEGVAY